MERYESDVEEESVSSGGGNRISRDQIIIRLSDRFLDEINTNGEVCSFTVVVKCYAVVVKDVLNFFLNLCCANLYSTENQFSYTSCI